MDLDTLIAALQDIRSAGIAYESEESTAEICCVAVPLAENGQVKAAISVTTPKFRYTDEKAADHPAASEKTAVDRRELPHSELQTGFLTSCVTICGWCLYM